MFTMSKRLWHRTSYEIRERNFQDKSKTTLCTIPPLATAPMPVGTGRCRDVACNIPAGAILMDMQFKKYGIRLTMR